MQCIPISKDINTVLYTVVGSLPRIAREYNMKLERIKPAENNCGLFIPDHGVSLHIQTDTVDLLYYIKGELHIL